MHPRRNQEQIKYSSECFAFQTKNIKPRMHEINLARCFVWMRILVSHCEEKVQFECVSTLKGKVVLVLN
jgi:hypothetical protein